MSIISLASIKGGVGKTTISANLAYVLAHDFNKKVLVVDANIASPNLGLQLGIMNPEHTLQNVLRDQIMACDAIYEHSFGFSVLLASLEKQEKPSLKKLKTKLQGLKKRFDFIILDTPPTMNDELEDAITASDEILILSSPDYLTLNNTLKTVRLAKNNKIQIRGLVLNKVRGKGFELKTKDIERITRVPALAKIPYNTNFHKALNEIKSYAALYPDSLASVEIRRLAANISNEKYKEPGVLQRLTARLKND